MSTPLTSEHIQQHFPFLKSGVAYLDNASTTQKPQVMIDAVTNYYTNAANVHRGIYALSEHASEQYEHTRRLVQQMLGAEHEEEIIFTSGATHSLNLAARLLQQGLEAGDEIIISEAEHHANLIPWQLVAQEAGARIVTLRAREDEQIYAEDLRALITDRTKVLAMTHMSNVTGYITPIRELNQVAHEFGIVTVVDGAQSIQHMDINVQELEADFFVFSAHKILGPTGVGVLYGLREILESAQPVYGGGSMIDEVTMESATWAPLPLKLEPGTPNIAGVIGLGAAITYRNNIGVEQMEERVSELTAYMRSQLQKVTGITFYGPQDAAVAQAIVSFTIQGVHPHDVAAVLDKHNVAVRVGHHCAQPLMRRWGVPSTVRASVAFYNTHEDIDRLVTGLQEAHDMLAV